MSLKIELARNLVQINAIKLSPQRPFQWASGLYSPIYYDNRVALLYPSVRDLIINGFVLLKISRTESKIVAGVATSGIVFGVLVAYRLNLPFVYVRSKAKIHGLQNLIEGYWDEGSRKILGILRNNYAINQ